MLADTVCGMSLDVHETLTGMFVARPWLAHEIIADVFSVDVPQYEEVRFDTEECTDPLLTAYRPDVVVLVGRGRPVLAVAVEVQLERDEARRESWPARVATTSARLGCPTLLLVICLDRAVATWCAEPIEVGPGATVRPLVLGPDQLPEVTSPLDAYRDRSWPSSGARSAPSTGPRGLADLAVVHRHPTDRLAPVHRAFLLAGQHPLCTRQPALSRAKMARGGDDLPAGGDHQPIQPEVDPDIDRSGAMITAAFIGASPGVGVGLVRRGAGPNLSEAVTDGSAE